MDKVNNGFTKDELWKFVETVNHLMKEFNLTEREVIGIFKLMTGFATDFDLVEQMALVNKKLLESPDEVNEGILWAGREVIQTTLDLPHSSKPKTDEIAEKLVNNIEKALLSKDKEETKKEIEDLAKSKFDNDLEMARYFLILKKIYPPLLKHESSHPRWREHFIIPPPTYDRWNATAHFVGKFKKIYHSKTKDISLFILANYFYMKESIDISKDICYATTNIQFINKYDSWYDYAENHIKEQKAKTEKAKNKRKIARTNKTDTL